MTLAAGTVWEVRTAGSDSACSGGFNPLRAGAGTDYSQSDTALGTGTNLTVDATTNTDVAPDGFTPSAADIGNLIQITSGAGFTAGFYEIVSIQAGKWRLDRSPAATTTAGGVWALGGGLASPGKASGAVVAGNTIWVKSGTYTVTSASSNIAGGCVVLVAGVSATASRMIGYGTIRGDSGTPPLIQASGISSFTLIATSNLGHLENLSVDAAGLTSGRGINLGTTARAYRCKVANCTNSGINSGVSTLCEVSGCSTAAGFNGTTTIGCVAHDNTVAGISGGAFHAFSLAYGNTGATSHGFQSNSASVHWFRCTSVGNGGDGFRATAGTFLNSAIDCLAVSNTGAGFGANSSFDNFYVMNCGTFDNGTAITNVTAAAQSGNIVLGFNPFTDPPNNDFSLNLFNPGGMQVRAASLIGSLPGLASAGYADLGALQSAAVYAQITGEMGLMPVMIESWW